MADPANRDDDGEHAMVLAGLDAVGIEVLAQQQLAGAAAPGPLGDDDHFVSPVGVQVAPL